jgi:hypothetical protein
MTDYRYPDPAMPAAFIRGLFQRLVTANETRRVSSRESRRDDDGCLSPMKPVRPLAADDVPLVFVIRDEIKLAPAFLDHYRRLGVTRFICVDDQSTDGTQEFLAAQADTDLWTSSLRFKDARRGRVWREHLFRHYGHDRWYLNVDSDEFLFYENCETTPLPALFRSLEAVGQKRIRTRTNGVRVRGSTVNLFPKAGCARDFSRCDAGGLIRLLRRHQGRRRRVRHAPGRRPLSQMRKKLYERARRNGGRRLTFRSRPCPPANSEILTPCPCAISRSSRTSTMAKPRSLTSS